MPSIKPGMTNYSVIVSVQIANAATSKTSHSIPSFAFTSVVDGLRARLAAGRLHHLADEPAGKGRLRLRLLGLVGIGGDDLIHRLLDRAHVGDLGEPPRLDDGARIAAFGEHDVEHILGDLAGDGAVLDQVEHGAETVRRDRALGDALAFLVEAAEQFVDHPVRGLLRLAALRHRLEIIRGLALGYQHVGVVG